MCEKQGFTAGSQGQQNPTVQGRAALPCPQHPGLEDTLLESGSGAHPQMPMWEPWAQHGAQRRGCSLGGRLAEGSQATRVMPWKGQWGPVLFLPFIVASGTRGQRFSSATCCPPWWAARPRPHQELRPRSWEPRAAVGAPGRVAESHPVPCLRVHAWVHRVGSDEDPASS